MLKVKDFIESKKAQFKVLDHDSLGANFITEVQRIKDGNYFYRSQFLIDRIIKLNGTKIKQTIELEFFSDDLIHIGLSEYSQDLKHDEQICGLFADDIKINNLEENLSELMKDGVENFKSKFNVKD